MKLDAWVWCATSAILLVLALGGGCTSAPHEHFYGAERAIEQLGPGFPHQAQQLPDDPAVEFSRVPLPDTIERRSPLRPGEPAHVRVWYRLVTTVSPGQEELAVYVPRQLSGWGYLQVFVEGRAVGDPNLHAANSWNLPTFAIAPLQTSPHVRTVEVMIAVTCDLNLGTSISTVRTGPPQSLLPRQAVRLLLQTQIPQALSLALIALGAFAFMVWLGNREETSFVLFALATVAWFLRSLHYYLGAIPFGEVWFHWASMNALIWIMVIVYLYSFRFQGERHPVIEKALLFLLATAAVLTLPVVGLDHLQVASVAYAAEALVSAGITILVTRSALRSRDSGALLLAASLWICIALGIHDLLLKDSRISIESVYLLPYGAIPLFSAFLFAVQRRYRAAIRDVQNLNLTLEERLTARTRELQETHERLRDTERQQATHAERQRLMREMHDGLGSSLMSSVAALEQGQASAADAALTLRGCVDELKLLIGSLEPIGGDLVILLAMLRYRLGRRLEMAGLQLEWKVSELPALPWLTAFPALHVLRILQEAITNILKHAGATRICISAEHDSCEIRVSVVDNGTGFDATASHPAGTGKRGLQNMQGRAREIGGSLAVRSTASGTSLTLSLPRQQYVDHDPRPEIRRLPG